MVPTRAAGSNHTGRIEEEQDLCTDDFDLLLGAKGLSRAGEGANSLSLGSDGRRPHR